MYSSLLFQTCMLLIFAVLIVCVQPPIMPNLDALNVKPKIEALNKIPLKGKPVPPCIACQSLTKSFLAAVEKTTRQSYAGGDADWEKLKLGNYENSELRFIEIQEMLCADVEFGRDQCFNLAEQHESELEDWFYEKRKEGVDLYASLCIDHIKVCCPNNTYGPKCIPCPGGVEKPCSGHGKCRKGGTREEPADCACDSGYIGKLCNECDKGYFHDMGASVFTCKKCDVSCKGHCRGPGPKNCEVCATGYQFIPDEGCMKQTEQAETVDSVKESPEADNANTSSEVNQSGHANASGDSENQDDDGLQLQSNMEDSSVNIEHSEF